MLASPRLPYLALIVALLIGAWLRLDGLRAMQDQLQYDEAYYAVNAISLIEQPRAQFFFPENTGREGMWMYILAPAIAIWGALPFTLRYVAAMVAILTLAAVARLAKEMLGKWGAVWAVLALSGFYMHLHNSHVAFRVLLFPLFGALALAWLLRAYRRNRPSDWLIAAIFTGLLAHTYTAAHGWLALIWGVGLLWLLFNRTRRRGALILLAVVPLLAAPVYISMLTVPAADGGIGRTLIKSSDELRFNIDNWVEAWRGDGDLNHNHNIPQLPLLDDPQTLLILIGLVGGFFVLRRRWYYLLLVALFVAALMPSIITLRTPQYIRAFGIVVPVAICLAAGAVSLQALGGRLMQRIGKRKGLPAWQNFVLFALPAALLLTACLNASANFHTWLATYRLSLFIDERINATMGYIRDNAPAGMPIYIVYGGLTGDSTLTFHPVAAFHAYQQKRTLTFVPFPESDDTCFVAPRRPTLFLDFPNIINRLGERMAAYGTVEALYRQPNNEYNIWQYTPDPELSGDWAMSAVMGDMLQVRSITPAPEIVRAGDTVQVTLGMRVLHPVDAPYRVFLHLQGSPTPYEGGTLFSTGDTPLCAAALLAQRNQQETIVQTFHVPIPADLPPGQYHIAVGMYNPTTNNRLPIAAPGGETRFYKALEFEVRQE